MVTRAEDGWGMSKMGKGEWEVMASSYRINKSW